jgi:hypothetical protein
MKSMNIRVERSSGPEHKPLHDPEVQTSVTQKDSRTEVYPEVDASKGPW